MTVEQLIEELKRSVVIPESFFGLDIVALFGEICTGEYLENLVGIYGNGGLVN